MLVVEQNANIALERLAPRVRARGRPGRASRAPSAELREHEGVRRSYLGY